ncbi:MFS transporter [Achromobacter kerstersii]|uniref:MFS transporter n=1 Tax=Achromobacter kerstersii TaxID=1353890 RepID=UPI0006C709BF|nr:MFS transporter [Achromobacter kerstersii]CUI74599.1 Inner membrane transport protein ynfM [Achromobacter kerstersii]
MLPQSDPARGEPEVRLPTSTVMLLAVACALSVANVYYAQPLLDAIGREFALDDAAVGVVVTATQLGCALALLFVVPLGDLLDRRRLMIGQLGLLVLALMAVALSSNTPWLLTGMVALGLLGTAMTQGLLALSAALAAPGERGRVVGAAQGGVVIGLLLARTVAGVVADAAGWRAVYVVSAVMAAVLSMVLMRRLPQRRLPTANLSYWALLRSLYTLLATEPVLRVRGMIALLMFAAISAFWTALVLPLSAPPHGLSHTAIGAFGLVGVLGVLMAARAGRWADSGFAQRTTGAGLLLLCLAWAPIALLDHSLWALALGVLILDVALQALHVTNQTMIFSISAQAHSRLVGAYMMFYAVGSGLGGIASTAVYARAGWLGVSALGAGISVVALLFWVATLPRKVSQPLRC